jgi:hypothetical protein
MALHRDIFWIGRQWAVTGSGMQAVNQKLLGEFDVEIARLWDDDWLDLLRAQPWLNAEDFAKGLAVARTRFPEPARRLPPLLPVEALLRAAVPKPLPVREPVAPKAAEAAKPAAPPQAEPIVEPIAVEAIAPTPSFLQMRLAGHSAKLVRMWRIQQWK